jgi:hemolysin-activating ACP:hemolysin acyltransferase
MAKLKWLEKLDEGAHAQVWKAEDDLGRQVAVKLIDPSIEQFSSALSHAKALARAKHKNVVDVYYVLEVNHPVTGMPVSAIVMELLHGGRLDEFLKSGRLSANQALQIGSELMDGLEHIHKSGLSHGDLHAGNIMVIGDKIKIIDILYLDTLNLLSTMSREARFKRDCLQLKMLLADLLERSELDFGEVRVFNTAASELANIEDIRKAFQRATDPKKTSKLDRRLEFAFARFQDPHFVDTESYAIALDEETSDDIVFPLLKRVIDTGAMRKHHAKYIASLWSRVSEDQQDSILAKVAILMNDNLPSGNWFPYMLFLDTLGGDVWLKLPEIQRLRIEAIMTQDILAGRFDIYASINRGGELGTWILGRGQYFDDRKTLIANICTMLNRDWYTQNYIGKYLISIIPLLGDTSARKELLIRALQAAVRNDAKLVKQNLKLLPKSWRQDLNEKKNR